MSEKSTNPEKKKRDWKKTALILGGVAVGAMLLF
jgi:hypothetical protein